MAFSSCRDRATEKRLADVESRLAQLEAKQPAKFSANPPTNAPTVSSTPETKPEGPLAEIKYDNNTFDFGSITEGQKVSHTYKVTNTGNAPLIIQNAQPSCGCTVPEWTKTPIPVGGTGYVKAEFDSKGKTGMQNKTITVTANTWPKVTQLTFRAQVNAK
ncbi:MAG TPA: DUF1573 domain-containing protein [Cytophagales bacterium]|nr:DUF1573 domain-containing protein [Cytophagales bacterium]